MSEHGASTFKELWETYCPCRLHRKNICLINITIACFGLVIWTVVVTMEAPETAKASNYTNLLIDNTKELKFVNLTTATAHARAKLIAAMKKLPKPKTPKFFLKDIFDAQINETLCKCLCQDVTKEALVNALMVEIKLDKTDNEKISSEINRIENALLESDGEKQNSETLEATETAEESELDEVLTAENL